MRRTTIAALAFTAAASLGAPPASAARFGFGISGGITVWPDFMACAQVYVPYGEQFVGTFTAVAEMQGPGTKVGTVRTVVPISSAGTWSYCIPGAYSGAVAGDGKFLLEVTSITGELTELQQCVIDHGSLTCV